jgi:hypothetical protein
MKTLKLLPCPHCGGEAQLELFDPPPQAIWSVSCKNDCSFDLCGGRAKAIAAWNRRSAPGGDALTKRITSLRDREDVCWDMADVFLRSKDAHGLHDMGVEIQGIQWALRELIALL